MNKKVKVLIVGQPFNKITGGGVTLTNLFGNWDAESLAVLCSPYLIDSFTDFSAASSYYQLGDLEHKWCFPFNLVKRKYFSGPVSFFQSENEKPDNQNVKIRSIRSFIINNIFFPTLRSIGFMPMASKTEISSQLDYWIQEFGPDLIYVQATSRVMLSFVRKLQLRYFGVPFVFHMMDDWPSTLRPESIFGWYWERIVNKEFSEVIKTCSLCLSISDLMSSEYLRRYNVTFIPFHNPIDVGFWKKGRKLDYDITSKFEILYAGRVGLGVDDSLKIVAQAIEIVNRVSSFEATLVLQTLEFPGWAKDFDFVLHGEYVPYEELPLKFGATDLLIIPYDFESKASAFIKYSMPTKASEYLASGTPVIVFAPKDTALVWFVEKYNCAAVVSVKSANVLAEAILQLVEEKERRELIGRKGSEVVDNFHNNLKVRSDFQTLLYQCLNVR